MPTPDVQHLNDVKLFGADRVLLDANVWWFLEGTTYEQPMNDNHQRNIDNYSKFYQQLLTRGCEIVIPQVVVSEFINLAIRKTKDRHSSETVRRGNVKEFRTNEPQAYAACMDDVKLSLDNMFNKAVQINHRFTSYPVEEIAADLQKAKLDYTDLIIARICSAEDLNLITHDKDFAHCELNIQIATCNPELLASS